MRLMILGAMALLTAPAAGQGRMGPETPWFREFEATCRADDEHPPMRADCQTGVLMGLGVYKGYTNGACDWYFFWDAADSLKNNNELFEVLPWQSAVEAIIDSGACEGYTVYGPEDASVLHSPNAD